MRHLATPRQLVYIDALEEHGSQAAAAAALDVHIRTLKRALAAVRHKAATVQPQQHMVSSQDIPAPYLLRGVSTNFDGDGNVRQVWIKTALDKNQIQEQLKAVLEELTEDVRGVAIPEPLESKYLDDDLLAVYPMGDPHLGMYAWAAEAGEDFDLDIAQRDITRAFCRLYQQAPNAKEALIINLGDFFHVDNNSNMTTRSGHIQDVDSRWAKVLSLGSRLMIRTIKMALAKHKLVTVRNVIGNHDDHSSMALSLILEAYFENEPRARIVTSPAQCWYFEFGKSLIGTHHGHSIKARDLPGVMAHDQAEAWGRTHYRYWYLGHVHHTEHNEWGGVVVEYFRTLAARDAYTQGAGYRSGRDLRCIVHHKEFGEVERFTMDIRRARTTYTEDESNG